MQRIFISWFKNYHVAIAVTGFIFSAVHFQFYGFVPRFLMGVLLGYMMVWSNNLWVPIIAHFTNNALDVIGYFFINRGMKESVLNFGSSPDTYIYTVIGTILMAATIYLLYRKRVKSTLV
jgi:hypothetical protein